MASLHNYGLMLAVVQRYPAACVMADTVNFVAYYASVIPPSDTAPT